VDQPFWQRIRDELERWYADYPDDEHGFGLRARFRKAAPAQHFGAWWELYLHRLFRCLGFHEVVKEVEPPDDSAVTHWIEFTKIMLELAGPLTHEVSSTVAAMMEFGVWAFGSDDHGGPSDEIQFKARELGRKLTERMAGAVKSYKRFGDVIVTDPDKLEYVGTHGDCIPTAEACPDGYSFTNADIDEVSADLRRTVERTAYEELLPLGFYVYGFNPGRSQEPGNPRCTGAASTSIPSGSTRTRQSSTRRPR
jgi:hypothetical protein